MKISLSNFFSVMAASSFVSSANALSLADYKDTQIVPGTSDTLDTTDATAVAAALAGACTIGAVTATGADLTCNFAYPLVAGSTIVAKLYSGACSATVGNVAVALAETDSSQIVASAGTTVADTITMDDFGVSGDSDKNTGTIVQGYCARADVWDDNNQESGSVLAYMMTVTTTTQFALNGSFETSVSTTAFTADAAAAAASRTIPVTAKFGSCASTSASSPYASAANDALPVQTEEIEIGEVLDICVYIADADADVTIDKLHTVTIKDTDTAGGVITTPISDAGVINFVTTLTADVNASGSNKAVTISTLMIPKILDTVGAGTIYISGVADLLYSRRLSSGERRLQSETAPFSMEVELTKSDLPQVAMNEEESGAVSAGVGMMALAAGVAALL